MIEELAWSKCQEVLVTEHMCTSMCTLKKRLWTLFAYHPLTNESVNIFVNRSSKKILNSKGNVQKLKVDRSKKIEKSTEWITESCPTPDLVQAFSEEKSGLTRFYGMSILPFI